MTPEEKMFLIRTKTDMKERKETANMIMCTTDLSLEREVEHNKVKVSVADFGEYIFISQTMILRKEGE